MLGLPPFEELQLQEPSSVPSRERSVHSSRIKAARNCYYRTALDNQESTAVTDFVDTRQFTDADQADQRYPRQGSKSRKNLSYRGNKSCACTWWKLGIDVDYARQIKR